MISTAYNFISACWLAHVVHIARLCFAELYDSCSKPLGFDCIVWLGLVLTVVHCIPQTWRLNDAGKGAPSSFNLIILVMGHLMGPRKTLKEFRMEFPLLCTPNTFPATCVSTSRVSCRCMLKHSVTRGTLLICIRWDVCVAYLVLCLC